MTNPPSHARRGRGRGRNPRRTTRDAAAARTLNSQAATQTAGFFGITPQQPAQSPPHKQRSDQIRRSRQSATNPSTPRTQPQANRNPTASLTRLQPTTWHPRTRDIFQTKAPLITHIPKKVRSEVRGALSMSIWDCVSARNPNIQNIAYHRLFAFSRCILLAIPRAQDRRSTNGTQISIAEVIRKRIAQWRSLETKSLWEQVKVKEKQYLEFREKRQPTTQQKANIARALRFAKEGAYSKAVKALSSEGIHKDTPAVREKLLQKHPQELPATDAGIYLEAEEPHPTPIELVTPVTTQEIATAIKRFPRASAGGGSGLTPTHLSELITSPEALVENGLLEALAALATKFLRKQAPQHLACWIAGAPMTALRKPEDGVRPIAVGETLRRMTSSIARARVKEQTLQLLAPHNVGVSVRSGGEAVIHAIRDLTEQLGNDPNYALLQIDLSNAFNLVSRRAFRREVAVHLPQISPWVEYCYGTESNPNLWIGDFSFKSVQGVQQGDPLGPLLFSIALRPILRHFESKLMSNNAPLLRTQRMLAFYMDDGFIIANHHALRTILDVLNSPEAKAYGLFLGTPNELWWPSPIPQNELDKYPPDVKINKETGTHILKAPIGSHSFMETAAKKIARKKAKRVAQLALIPDSHVVFTLLRATLGISQMNYILRTTPTTATDAASEIYDNATAEVLRKLAGGTLPITTLAELRLPQRIKHTDKPHFGIGVTSARTIAPAAYLSSITTTRATSAKLLTDVNLRALSTSPLAQQIHANIKACLPSAEAFPDLNRIEEESIELTQHDLTAIIHNYKIDNIPTGDERTAAFRRTLSLPGSKAWLQCAPSPTLRTYIANSDLNSAQKKWIHMATIFYTARTNPLLTSRREYEDMTSKYDCLPTISPRPYARRS